MLSGEAGAWSDRCRRRIRLGGWGHHHRCRARLGLLLAAVVDVKGYRGHLLVSSMYVPDGIDDVSVPWWVVVGITECKSVLYVSVQSSAMQRER